jgi:hypothetical protein
MDPDLILGAIASVWVALAILGSSGHRWAAYLAMAMVLVVGLGCWLIVTLVVAFMADCIGHPWCQLSVRPGTACTELRRAQIVGGCGILVIVIPLAASWVAHLKYILKEQRKKAKFIENYDRYIKKEE